MLLNRNNQVIGIGSLSQGGLTGSLIDIRVILQYALKTTACAVPTYKVNRLTELMPQNLEL